jgi:hypothetical protein
MAEFVSAQQDQDVGPGERAAAETTPVAKTFGVVWSTSER